MASSLPRFVVLRSSTNGKYLQVEGDVEDAHYRYLKFQGNEATDPCAKFALEESKNKKNLVHIRSCYNNKYWVIVKKSDQSQDYYRISAAADHLEEDESNVSCTLFKYDRTLDNKIQFEHQNLNLPVQKSPTDGHYMLVGPKSTNSRYACNYEFIDWETLVILPRNVAFKSNNGKYLHLPEGSKQLLFSADNIAEATVGNEIFTNSDGSIRIRLRKNGRFWRCDRHWINKKNNCIRPDAEDSFDATRFWPVKIGDNVIALRNSDNDQFCKRSTYDRRTDCLRAEESSVVPGTELVVEELVIERKIYNVNFRLEDARVYDQTVLTMARAGATNMSTSTCDQELSLAYEENRSSSWDDSCSIKTGFQVEIKTNVLLIQETGVKVSGGFEKEYHIGEIISKTTQLETVYRVSIPPMTKVTVSLTATQGYCEVPYSYAQRDTLVNGDQITYAKDDGVYRGVNCFNFDFKVDETPLIPKA